MAWVLIQNNKAHEIFETETRPELHESLQLIETDQPVKVGQNYDGVSFYDDEPKFLKEEEILLARKRVLAKTDWLIIRYIEQGIPIPEEVLVYRQAIRDLPNSEGYPYDMSWPELDGDYFSI